MALGDVVRDECGREYIVTWDGSRGCRSLLAPVGTKPLHILEGYAITRDYRYAGRRTPLAPVDERES